MALIVRPLTARLLDSAPEQGNGLHRWLIKGARECQLSGVKPDRAFDLIAATVVARGGEIIPHSIRQAIEKAYSQSFTGGKYDKRPVWPEPREAGRIAGNRARDDGSDHAEIVPGELADLRRHGSTLDYNVRALSGRREPSQVPIRGAEPDVRENRTNAG